MADGVTIALCLEFVNLDLTESVALVANESSTEYIYIDTCASCHMLSSSEGMTDLVNINGRVIMAGKSFSTAIKQMGTKNVTMLNSANKPMKFAFSEVKIAPGLDKFLLSFKLLLNKGIKFDFDEMLMKIPYKQTSSANGAIPKRFKTNEMQYFTIPMVWVGNLLSIKIVKDK